MFEYDHILFLKFNHSSHLSRKIIFNIHYFLTTFILLKFHSFSATLKYHHDEINEYIVFIKYHRDEINEYSDSYRILYLKSNTIALLTNVIIMKST